MGEYFDVKYSYRASNCCEHCKNYDPPFEHNGRLVEKSKCRLQDFSPYPFCVCDEFEMSE